MSSMSSIVPMSTSSAVDTRSSYYQDLKSRIHQELLNRLDLDRLARMRREDAEPEIRGLIVGMIERESAATPLSLFERESLITDVINELFGLGPSGIALVQGENPSSVPPFSACSRVETRR